MINAGKLLEQFLGSSAGNAGQLSQKAKEMGSQMNIPGGNFTGGAVAGGLVGLLLGSKKVRKMAGGVAGYGGAAAAGALAFKAYQNWQQGKSAATAPMASPEDMNRVDAAFLLPTDQSHDQAQLQDFGLTLVSAMIAAANADGHIDANEQKLIFDQVEKLSFDAESKAFVFDTLRNPPSLDQLVASVQGIEQASEVYLVSRLAVDADHPAERAYLQALAHKLNLPQDLVAHLEHQVTGQ